MAYDVNKIEAFLSHQRKGWKRPGSFITFVDSLVYRFVRNNSPFDNQVRLDKISSWVNQRGNEFEGSYLYWNGTQASLESLYNELVKHKLVDVNPYFLDSFKKLDIKGKYCTTWNGSNRQLMWLLYLIYDKQDRYNNFMLHQIAVNLFKNNKPSFGANNLSTTLRSIITDFNGGLTKSKWILQIEDIFNSATQG
jgi:hypothetical protein